MIHKERFEMFLFHTNGKSSITVAIEVGMDIPSIAGVSLLPQQIAVHIMNGLAFFRTECWRVELVRPVPLPPIPEGV